MQHTELIALRIVVIVCSNKFWGKGRCSSSGKDRLNWHICMILNFVLAWEIIERPVNSVIKPPTNSHVIRPATLDTFPKSASHLVNVHIKQHSNIQKNKIQNIHAFIIFYFQNLISNLIKDVLLNWQISLTLWAERERVVDSTLEWVFVHITRSLSLSSTPKLFATDPIVTGDIAKCAIHLSQITVPSRTNK